MGKCYSVVVTDLALKEVGYHEKASKQNLEDKTANSGNKNYNKYAQFIDEKYPVFYNGKKQGAPWCEIFVDCMFILAYGYANALRLLCQPEKSSGAGVNSSMKYYKNKGRFFSTPEHGAQIFFKNGENYHTGIVIDFTDDTVTTVEGNASDAVRKKNYKLTDKSIIGYGHPAFDGRYPEDDVTPECGTLTLEVDTSKYSKIEITLR